jgi:hypothetical protein
MKKTGSVLALLATLILSCSPKPPHERDPFGLNNSVQDREMNATVVLLDAITLEPHCSATSVVLGGSHVLTTAAHCVTHKFNEFDPSPFAEKTASLGDVIYFVPRSRPNARLESRLSSYDGFHDRAILTPADPNDLPEPMLVSDLCEHCAVSGYAVHYIGAMYGWARHDGDVNGRVIDRGAMFWQATTDIRFGWSGSPAINSDGRMVGIVSRCQTKEYPTGTDCVDGYSLFVDVR